MKRRFLSLIFGCLSLVVSAVSYAEGTEILDKTQIIDHLDHIVFTVADIEKTVEFYTKVGMKVDRFGQGRYALTFGHSKINLHQKGKEFEPKAAYPTPGAIDLCLISKIPVAKVKEYLESQGIPIVEGPVKRTGAVGPILSIYFRDPDANLIEISNY